MISNNGEVTIGARRKNQKTFIRHFTYDFLFAVENIILATYGYNLTLDNSKEQHAKNLTICISILFHILGLLLKILYYKKFHLWSDLITLTHENSLGDTVFETEFTCVNKIIRVEKIVWSNEEGKKKRRQEAQEAKRIISVI